VAVKKTNSGSQLEKNDVPQVQTVILYTRSGVKAKFSGPVQLLEGDSVVKIEITPAKPLPPGCKWENVEEDNGSA
jgi:hypothetical protein